ncbi:unnamed protein product [Mycena citricolor]|uniref:SWI5-dependent HO expression protein 3 n=1 Tax=Mycena citricolor TaxID=2018698 RepID=A0AAD2H3Y2_9AGAR|nr:unnamed protein product [Mycena citricolor]
MSSSFASSSTLTTPNRDRPSSRSSITSGKSSNRSPSPAFSVDDPVAVRNQVSTLRHSIRHQQAKLMSLENVLLQGPRPYPPELVDSLSSTSTPSSAMSFPSSRSSASISSLTTVTTTPPSSPPSKRRSSYDVLRDLAPESNLPLPRREGRDSNAAGLEDFKDGVPMDFEREGGSSGGASYKRLSSPTRTLSRIPVSSVGNARALADDGAPALSRPISSSKLTIDTVSAAALSPSSAGPNTLHPASSVSPGKRLSTIGFSTSAGGGTTKVLADLQTGVLNARTALENTKAQLRLAQRSVAQLTRQTEDLKEGRERLRLENEGLNNVVARKERLLQEVLERARKAETESAALKTQSKTETTSTKKTIRELELALAESSALSQKSEREYITLRDSMKGMVEGFARDIKSVREEASRRDDRVKAECEGAGKRYKKLVDEVRKKWTAGANDLVEVEDESGKSRSVTTMADLKRVWAEERERQKQLEKSWAEQIALMKQQVENSNRESTEAIATASELAAELGRLRRLMQNVRPVSVDKEDDAP